MTITLDDQTALRRYVTKQDPEAFQVLAARYQSMVFATCRRSLGNDADAEDAAQETFLKFARNAGKIKSNTAAWLHACAVGTSIDLIRRSSNRRTIERDAATRKTASSASNSCTTWRDIEPLLDEALAKLDPKDRDLIVARFLAGRSQTELAREAGVSDGTMHRRTERALGKLRIQLASTGFVIGGIATLATTLTHATSTIAPPTTAATSAAIAKVGLAGIATRTPHVSKTFVALAAGLAACTAVTTAVLLQPRTAPPTIPAAITAAIPIETSQQPQLGPARLTSRIGPFESVSAMDGSFSERGVWISKERLTIAHGTTDEGEPKRANLRIRSVTPDLDNPKTVTIESRVERITPIGDPYSRFKLGQVVTITAEFDERQRVVLTPITPGVQLGRNEPKWFGVRPPIGWPEYARIPDDAGPHNIIGPWTEAERIPVTIDAREINFGASTWTERRYRIIEWTQQAEFSRVLSVNAGGRDPRLIGTRFRLLIREDNAGYSIAFFPPGEPREGDWPSSFEFSADNPVRVISFKKDDG